MSKKDDIKISYRAADLKGGPKTLNRSARSLDFVITTETPVGMYDWERGEVVPEVLLAQGMVMPKQVPLLDTHDRYSVSTVLGSVRNRQVEDTLVSGTAVFSTVPAAEEALTKYEEGHLTDFSAGYIVNTQEYVEKGKKADIGGRTWSGPKNVVTSWTLKEVSCCPIGADPNAKARTESKNSKSIKDTEMEDNERIEKLEGTVAGITDSLNKLSETLSKKFEAEENMKKGEQDVEEMRKKAIAAKHLTIENERKRLIEIDKMCERFDIDDDFRAKMIEDGTDVNKARELVMERMSARTNDAGLSIKMGKEDRTKLREVMTDGIMLRAGIGTEEIEKDNHYRSYTLAEMARDILRFNNVAVPATKEELFKRAMSTDDFDNIMADAANKALNDGFEKAEETYSQWVDTTGVLNDYKGHQFSRASEAPSLLNINPEGGEYKYGIMTDTKETVTAMDYGVILPFTRAAMINDDLGALADIRMKLGEAAARKYGDLCYAVLTTGISTYTMGDGSLLFTVGGAHANYVTSGGAPSLTTISAGFTAMAIQKDLQGVQSLNITPKYILAPWALKAQVENVLVQTTPTALATAIATDPKTNPFPLTPVYDARLDTADSTGWYLAARKGKTVKLFTLNGQMAPTLESKVQWATDSIEFKCRISAAAAAMDYRGLYFNDGE